MGKVRYFDHAATTAVKKEVLEEKVPYFNLKYGNPSALYSVGISAKKGLDQARSRVAKVLNAKPDEIYFTSGGSESDNLAIKGVAYANRKKGNHIITTKIEHPAVINTCRTLQMQGYDITFLNVDSTGMINLNELKDAITDKTILISIMFANNEIGTIEPIEEIGKIARQNNIYFHTDAVQAVGNIKIDVNKLGIDLLSMSAHKFYGPKGVGALYVRENVDFAKIIDGGHQEKDKRAGTENIPGIVGLGKAIELAYENIDEYNNKLINLRDYCIQQMQKRIPNIKLNGHRTNRLPGNINMLFQDVDGKKLLEELNNKGICASAGSACSAKSSDASHVLLAIGLKPMCAQSSLRITLGDDNTKEDIDYLVDNLEQLVKELRR